MAHGRVQSAQNPASFPVLTGMPVAGMAYLDRPTPGGYFIFPDLSVRHEGKFRLSFNLYEELKESKDEDVESAHSSPETKDIKPPRNPGIPPKNHVFWRLEVKSVPFSVFSAKKFPGLAESTNLSRVVAEQGCRVRIRRDVRMRRRDTKSKDYDDFDESGYARTDRFATPVQQIPERPRSISNGSIHGSVHGSIHGSVEPTTPYALEHRRSSGDLGYSYNQQPSFAPVPAPPQPVQTPTYSSHLTFGSSASQFAAPTFQPPAAPVSQPAQRYAQTSHDYHYQPNGHRQMSASQNFAYPPSQPQTPTYQQPQPSIYSSNSVEYKPIPSYRRASLPPSQQSYPNQSMNQYNQSDTRQNPTYVQVDTRQNPAYPQVDTRQNPLYPQIDTRQSSVYPQVDSRHNSIPSSYYTSPSQSQGPRSATPTNSSHVLPPIQTLPPPHENKYEPGTPTATLPTPTGSSSSSGYENLRSKAQQTYPTSAPMPATNTIYDPTRTQGKRSHDQVFDSSHQYQAVHNGIRPATYNHGQDVPQIQADDGSLMTEYEIEPLRELIYRRADGSKQVKKCPSPLID